MVKIFPKMEMSHIEALSKRLYGNPSAKILDAEIFKGWRYNKSQTL